MAKLTGAERSAKNNALKGTAMTHQVAKNGQIISSTPITYAQASKTQGSKLPSGVYTNKTTGAYYNAQGQQVDSTGKVIVTPQSEKTATYADIGKSMLNQDFVDTSSLGAEIGLQTESSWDEYVNNLKAQQNLKYEQERAQLDQQQTELAQSTSDARNAREMGTELATAGLYSSGREGVTSLSNVGAAGKLKTATQQYTDRLLASQQASQDSIARVRESLAIAEKQGNTELVQGLRSQLLAAEQNAKAIDTEYISALTDAAKTELTMKSTGISGFQSLVDSGTEMSYEAIKSYASDYGLDTEMLMDFYEGSKAIREDKTLSLEEKQVALSQAKQDLQDQIAGLTTAQAQNVDYLKKLYASGADPEIISAFKSAVGITDYDDPITVAQLRLDNANAKIKEIEASGEPIYGSQDYWDREQARLDVLKAQSELSGVYGDEVTPEQAQGIFTLEGTSKYRTDGWECGEGYNKITDGGKVGDSYTSKLGLTVGADGKPRQTSPMVGNGLAIPIGDANIGHVETVISVNPATNTFQTVSWNRNLDGQQTVQTYNLSEMNSKYGNNWGFTDSTLKPEYLSQLAQAQSGTTAETDAYSYNSFYNQAIADNVKPELAEKYAYDQYKAANSPMTEAQSKSYSAYLKTKSNADIYDEATTNVDMQKFATGVNSITGKLKNSDTLTADVVNTLIDDVNLRRAIMAEIRWVEGKLRKESGAAITVEEYKSNGAQFFPRLGDDEQTIKDKEAQRAMIEQTFYGEMGMAGQKLAGTNLSQPEEENTDPDSLATEFDPVRASYYDYAGLSNQ